MDQPHNIESREIRGFSLKTVYAIVIGTGVSVMTIMGSYQSLNAQMLEIKSDMRIEKNERSSRIQSLEQSVAELKIEVLELRKKLLR